MPGRSAVAGEGRRGVGEVPPRESTSVTYQYLEPGLDINHWPAGPAGVFHSGGQSGQWTKESAGPKGPAIISSDHKVFVLHWPEV